MSSRRKFSAVKREFQDELRRLLRLDADNQARLYDNVGRPARGELSPRQLYLLTEGILFTGYRAFENLVHDVFVLYCLGKRNDAVIRAVPYLNPRNFEHAEALIQSSLRYLDWTNPDEVVKRAELYLKNGDPVKMAFISRRTVLVDLRDLRNHIAHNSKHSRRGYLNLLQRKLGTAPLRPPAVGEFLLMQDREEPTRHYLISYLGALEEVCETLTG
jgi:hypothetical protein